MANVEPGASLSLEHILDDIEGLLEQLAHHAPLTYGTLQQELDWKPNLHLINYIRFFEQQGWVAYDRISDEVDLLEAGRHAPEVADEWTDVARIAFSEHLDAVDHTSESFGEISLAEFEELNAEVLHAHSEPHLSHDLAPNHTGPTPTPTAKKDRPMTSELYRAGTAASSSKDLYERGSEVGSGGIGTVYEGVQKRLGRPVAIKEIKNIFHVFADIQRDDLIERFREIIQTHATLEHPNIVQIYDVITDEEYPYVVMQWAPKGSLRRLIDTSGRPPLNVALSYFMQILHALHTAHEQGVVHGGLKPENVVLDPSGNALITDFGIIQVVERATGVASNQVYVGVGTVEYLAPEQFRDPNLASVQSDIYSLGIMFYEMLTGKVPGRRSPMPSSFYPDIPRKLDDIFDRMSMDDRTDRYTTVREVLTELYNSPEVLDIMDKRSGVLFLRDPLVHGELGVDDEVIPIKARSSTKNYQVEGHFESYDDRTEFDDSSSKHASAPDDDADDDEVTGAHAKPGDVLDKLDKYSELFDEDQNDA